MDDATTIFILTLIQHVLTERPLCARHQALGTSGQRQGEFLALPGPTMYLGKCAVIKQTKCQTVICVSG